MTKQRYDRGFTLIEILAVIVLLITVGSIIGTIFFSSLRGSNKTNALTTVRQNGNYAISQITKTLRNSKQLDAPFPCATPPPFPTPLPTYSSITITSYGDQTTTFSCSTGPPATIASNSASLLDTRSVILTTCYFTCTQSSFIDPPTIGIHFALNTLNTGLSLFTERTASATAIPFTTTVELRNFAR